MEAGAMMMILSGAPFYVLFRGRLMMNECHYVSLRLNCSVSEEKSRAIAHYTSLGCWDSSSPLTKKTCHQALERERPRTQDEGEAQRRQGPVIH